MTFLDTAVVPLITALDDGGVPDAAAVDPLLVSLADAGITVLMLFGSNGEGPNLDAAESCAYLAEVRRRWRELTGSPARVFATAAGTGTVAAVRRAERYVEAGVDAIVAMPPTYYRHAPAELVAHFDAVTRLGVPVIVYDQPTYTGNVLTPAVYRELVQREVIVGVKVSSADPAVLTDLVAVREQTPTFEIASGVDRAMVAALRAGVDGLVLGTAMLAPRACLDLIAAVRDGDVARAERLQIELEALLDIHRIRPGVSGIVAMKTALAELGLSPAHASAPFVPFDDDERARVRAVLDRSALVAGH